jgi:hypothetical protein
MWGEHISEHTQFKVIDHMSEKERRWIQMLWTCQFCVIMNQVYSVLPKRMNQIDLVPWLVPHKFHQ